MTGTVPQKMLDLHRFRPRLGVPYPHAGWGLRNFGDELTPFLISALKPDIRVAHADCPQAEVVAIGSVLHRAIVECQAGTAILGAGLPDAIDVPRRARVLDYQFVRGELTRKLLNLRVPTGDPGLALSALPRAEGGQQTSCSLIQHFRLQRTSKSRRQLAAATDRLGARAVLVSSPVNEVLGAISASEFVLTTSLHGLIVADAWRIPALAVTEHASPRRDFRFDDYHSALGLEPSPLIPLQGLSAPAALQLGTDRSRRLGSAPTEKGHELAELMRGWLSRCAN